MSGMNGTTNGHSNGSKWSAGGLGSGGGKSKTASTPTFLRKVSSSDTPPNTWNRNDQVTLPPPPPSLPPYLFALFVCVPVLRTYLVQNFART